MRIVQLIIWRKKLQENDEVLDYTYFEKQYNQIFS